MMVRKIIMTLDYHDREQGVIKIVFALEVDLLSQLGHFLTILMRLISLFCMFSRFYNGVYSKFGYTK
jgi:hypothetical protein